MDKLKITVAFLPGVAVWYWSVNAYMNGQLWSVNIKLVSLSS